MGGPHDCRVLALASREACIGLASGGWLLAAGWESETGNWKLEAGNYFAAARSLFARSNIKSAPAAADAASQFGVESVAPTAS